MTTRLYLIPMDHVPLNGGGSYECPPYLPHRFNPPLAGLENVSWALDAYLLEDLALVAADVTGTQHTLLTGAPGVLAVPTNLGQTLSAAQALAVQTRLANERVPHAWVEAGLTYRQVLRRLLSVFQIHNRVVGLLHSRIFGGAITLDTTVGDLPTAVRTPLREGFQDLGLDTSGVTGSMTLRDAFLLLAEQREGTAVYHLRDIVV